MQIIWRYSECIFRSVDLQLICKRMRDCPKISLKENSNLETYFQKRVYLFRFSLLSSLKVTAEPSILSFVGVNISKLDT